jgi:hypothetical protein
LTALRLQRKVLDAPSPRANDGHGRRGTAGEQIASQRQLPPRRQAVRAARGHPGHDIRHPRGMTSGSLGAPTAPKRAVCATGRPVSTGLSTFAADPAGMRWTAERAREIGRCEMRVPARASRRSRPSGLNPASPLRGRDGAEVVRRDARHVFNHDPEPLAVGETRDCALVSALRPLAAARPRGRRRRGQRRHVGRVGHPAGKCRAWRGYATHPGPMRL